MGYDFSASNPSNGVESDFHLGAFSWPVLCEAMGYLFPCVHGGAQWYCVFGADPRMPRGDDYPRLISNDGFPVTAEEAKIIARIARNFVAVQRSLPESHRSGGLIDKGTVTKDDLVGVLAKAMSGKSQAGPWPLKIRDDFTDKFERFAEWADHSGGFTIH